MLFFSNFNYALLREWEGIDEIGVLIVGLRILVIIIRLVSSCKDVKREGGRIAGGFFIREMVGLVCLGSLLFFRACR